VSVTFYQSGKLKRFQTLPQLIERETKNSMRRGQNRLRRALLDEFPRGGGIAAKIFGRGYTNASTKTVIAREKVLKLADLYEVAIRVKGLAAIVAKGDIFKSHKIGKAKKLMGNVAAGFIARGIVQHPGGRARKDDFTGRAMSKTGSAFREEVSKGMDKVAAVVNG